MQTGRPKDSSEPPPSLVRDWALCAIAAAAARFIPVPLMDDSVREHATRISVARTLRAHGRSYPVEAVEPLYGDLENGFVAAAKRAAAVPRKVALFPVRKYVAIFGTARGVPNDVMQVLLLSRSVHRALAAGRLVDVGDPVALRREAVAVRTAHDAALKGMDLRLFKGALADGLSRGRSLTAAATGYARRRFGRSGTDADAALSGGTQVDAGAVRVGEVLRRPEVGRLLAEVDARFDARMAKGA